MLISIKVVKSLRVGTINIKTAKNRLVHDIMSFLDNYFHWDILGCYSTMAEFRQETMKMVNDLDFDHLIDYISDIEGSDKLIQKIENYKKLVV